MSREGVEAAAREGWKQLMQGASAVTAVQAAIAALEDNPEFDAGIFIIKKTGCLSVMKN